MSFFEVTGDTVKVQEKQKRTKCPPWITPKVNQVGRSTIRLNKLLTTR